MDRQFSAERRSSTFKPTDPPSRIVKPMGWLETDRCLAALKKANFDLKLELYYHREKTDRLEAELAEKNKLLAEKDALLDEKDHLLDKINAQLAGKHLTNEPAAYEKLQQLSLSHARSSSTLRSLYNLDIDDGSLVRTKSPGLISVTTGDGSDVDVFYDLSRRELVHAPSLSVLSESSFMTMYGRHELRARTPMAPSLRSKSPAIALGPSANLGTSTNRGPSTNLSPSTDLTTSIGRDAAVTRREPTLPTTPTHIRPASARAPSSHMPFGNTAARTTTASIGQLLESPPKTSHGRPEGRKIHKLPPLPREASRSPTPQSGLMLGGPIFGAPALPPTPDTMRTRPTSADSSHSRPTTADSMRTFTARRFSRQAIAQRLRLWRNASQAAPPKTEKKPRPVSWQLGGRVWGKGKGGDA